MARYALIVGISDYNSGQLARLSKASGDAEAISSQLKQCEQLTIEPTVLSGTVTTPQLSAALKQFAETAKGQEAIIYFTGHGISVTDALDGTQGYLATTDCTLTKVKGQPATGQSGAILFSSLSNWARSAEFSSLIMLIDTCHSGDFIEHSTYNRGFSSAQESKNYTVIAACHAAGGAFAKKDDDHSLFTGAVLQALQPENRDEKNAITSGRSV